MNRKMARLYTCCLAVLLIQLSATLHFTSGQEFAVRFQPNVTDEFVNKVALSNGYRAIKIKAIPGLYTFEALTVSNLNRRDAGYVGWRKRPNLKFYLNQKHPIVWIEQQRPLLRVKRDLLPLKSDHDHDDALSGPLGHTRRLRQNSAVGNDQQQPPPLIQPNGPGTNGPIKHQSNFQVKFPGQNFSPPSPSPGSPFLKNEPVALAAQSSGSVPPDRMKTLQNMLSQLMSSADLMQFFNSNPFVQQTAQSNQLPSVNQFNDELYKAQWYLVPASNELNRAVPSVAMHVPDVWQLGITGKGVVVTVIDDGLEWNHTDLIGNYDPDASTDINGRDDDPSPAYSGENAHGTRCGGEIAMEANNRKCGVGVAFNSRLGGIRLLDGPVHDSKEAEALTYGLDHIHIYSSSWGPNDDGQTVDGPKTLAAEALERGVEVGRDGRGAIYVWASGNGGSKGDNCNCDGYVGSIYTLAVGSVSQNGKFPWYGEQCASLMTVTYSSNKNTEQKVATTDLNNRCTTQHTGTSAAAPIAAGIIALLLEANPNLTWRDVQHLVVWTSDFSPIKLNPGWRRNGAGLMYNDRFGFGLMNALALIEMGQKWINVPRKAVCTEKPLVGMVPAHFKWNGARATFETNSCHGSANEVNFLEHVQVTLTISYPVRGNLEIVLLSPAKTVSYLLTPRSNDNSVAGFSSWNFTSVHFWGENPMGIWNLVVRDRQTISNEGMVWNAMLHLHGTAQRPNHMQIQPRRVYADEAIIPSIIDQSEDFVFNQKKEADFLDWHH